MKKAIPVLLAAALICSLAACTGNEGSAESSSAPVSEPVSWPEPEELEAEILEIETTAPEDSFKGEWYTSLSGMVFCLDLKEDGSYTASFSGLDNSEETGRWNYGDDVIRLEGEENDYLVVYSDGLLSWESRDLFLTREEPLTYEPAKVWKDADAAYYDGYWCAAYIRMNNLVLPAAFTGEETDIYIEGNMVALGGPRFGDIGREFTPKDGALTLTDTLDGEKMTVVIGLQEDGLLRMTVEKGGEETVLYLEYTVPYSDPDAAEGE